jgi:VIT1/CCC1 family predicted Fe2+/Mn2+ transporter
MADRIEREIEEILKKIDNFVPDKAAARRPVRKVSQPLNAAQGWVARRLAAISLNQVMGWSLLLVLATFFLREVPGVTWVMIGGLIVFVTAFVLSLLGGGRPQTTEKRWRGEPIDLSGPGWPDRLKAWIKSRKKA